MSKEYETLELVVSRGQKAVIDAVMNEGALRERERIIAILDEEFWEVDEWLLERIENPDDHGEEEWACGDCGTVYPSDVHGCTKDLDDYLGVRGYASVEEAIMGAAQKVIDNFETTYDKPRGGNWVVIDHSYRWQADGVFKPGVASYRLGPAMATTYIPPAYMTTTAGIK